MELRAILDGVRAAPTLAVGGRLFLRQVSGLVAAAGLGAPLRSALHLRPQGGYRGLVVVDGAGAIVDAGAQPLPATEVWQHVEDALAPVVVDMGRAKITRFGKAGRSETTLSSVQRPSVADRVRALVIVPVLFPGPEVAGMASIHLADQPALGSADIGAFARDVQLLTDVLAPHLVTLPTASPPQAAVELSGLPVVGRAMQPVVSLVQTFARQSGPVMFLGESGTGKSTMARICHGLSPRVSGPFVSAGLHEVPPDLQAALLFGAKKGSFTGSIDAQEGLVARAAGGVLFIDDIDALGHETQGRLLRLIDEKQYSVVGESVVRKADIRFMCGSNTDLADRARNGSFRLDLYYRLAAFPVTLPPLSERRDEIEGWARHFLAAEDHEAPSPAQVDISREAVSVLEAQAWVGNLRELRNVILRARAFALAETTSPRGAVAVVDVDAVRRSLALSGSLGQASLLATLDAAAGEFFERVARRTATGVPGLDLEDATVFTALVLQQAVRRTGSLKAAYRALGLGERLGHSNEKRRWLSEQDKLDRFRRALAQG